MHYKKVVISFIQTAQGRLQFEQFYLGISKELCCSKSIVSFEKFVSICLTTSYMDFSLYMDFYFVICVLCPPEAATSRFLFHVTVLSACSYQKGESEKGKLEEGTTQTLPCR